MKVESISRITPAVLNTGSQNLHRPSKRATWLHSVVASVGFGLGMFTPTFVTTANAQETVSEERLDDYKAYQAKKLNELLALPENRVGEIASGLSELSNYYNKNAYGHEAAYGFGVGKQYNLVVEAASPQLKQLFKKGFDLLVSNDLQKQKIGSEIISRMPYLFPPSWLQTSIGEILGAKDTMAPFFNGFLEKKNIADDLIFDSGLSLLGLSGGNEAYATTFVNLLSRNVDEASKEKFNEGRYKSLDTAVKKLISYSYNVLPNSVEKKTKIVEPLLISYINLIEKNGNNTNILKSGIDLVPQFKGLYSHYPLSAHKTYESNILKLIETTIRNISKLEESDTKQKLMHDSLHLPYYFKDSNKELNEILIDVISKNLLREDGKNKNKIFYSLYDRISWNRMVNGTPGTQWSPYANLKLVEQNPKFFTSAVDEVLDDYKNKKIYTDKLIDIFIFLNDIPRMTKGYGIDESPKELKEKVDLWLRDNVRKQIFAKLSEGFKDEKVNVTISKNRRERYVDSSNWNSLVNYFDKLTPLADFYNNDLLNVIKTRLQEEKDIYNKEALYGSLGLALDREANGKLSPGAIFIKSSIANENDHETVRGIGKALGFAFNRQKEAQKGFFKRQLNTHNEGVYYLYDVEADSKVYTETEHILIDCVKILGGSSKAFKAYLPDRKFEVTREGKLKDPSDFDAILRLRRNAFLVFAYTAKEYPDNTFKKEVISILEKRIEKYGKLDNLGEAWGHQITALLDVYRSVGIYVEDNEKFVKDKTDFLNKVFFQGRSVTHIIDGEEKVYKTEPLFEELQEAFSRRVAQEKGVNWYTLSKDERKDVLESGEVKKSARLAREKIAEVVFKVAPHNSVTEFRSCLREIGRGYCFNDFDLSRALDSVFESE